MLGRNRNNHNYLIGFRGKCIPKCQQGHSFNIKRHRMCPWLNISQGDRKKSNDTLTILHGGGLSSGPYWSIDIRRGWRGRKGKRNHLLKNFIIKGGHRVRGN